MELRPAELLKEWQTGKFRPVYYFFGEESAAKADAVLKLKELFKADDFNLREFMGEPNSEAPAAVAEALTLPVFSDKRLVIVRSPKLPAEARAIFADYLKSPSATTTLVLLSEDRRPDKKDALANAAAAAGAACIFSPLTDEEATGRLIQEAKKAGKTLAPDAADALVGEAGTDWGILAGELEKLILFVGAAPEIDAASALQCLGYRKSADPWALEKLAQGRDVKACLGYLREAFAGAKPEEVVFRSVAQVRNGYLKQLKAKRLLKAGMPQREIETRLRVFYDTSFFARAARVSEERLRRDLRRCLEVEADLKSKAWLDPKLELERLVVELCSPTSALDRLER
jgi:DNA polymerase-3 subunit delta